MAKVKLLDILNELKKSEAFRDFVQVVRCKDCKHSRTDDSNYDCYRCEFTPGYAHFASGFCERGERKEDE